MYHHSPSRVIILCYTSPFWLILRFAQLSGRSHSTLLFPNIRNPGEYRTSSFFGDNPKVWQDRLGWFGRHPVRSVVPRVFSLLMTQHWVRLIIQSPTTLSEACRGQSPSRRVCSVGGSQTTATRVSESNGITDPGD